MKDLQRQKKQARLILKKLSPFYAKDPIEVHYRTPFQLVVGVILSAQSTDKTVNQVTKKFFPRFRKPEDFLKLTEKKFQEMIRPAGFFRQKAKNILKTAKLIVEHHQGKIPKTMAALVKLPGFGRKSANVILHELYGIAEGICVDTHVLRLSKRLGLSEEESPVAVERDLMAVTPKAGWKNISHFLVLHGRRVCFARKPNCNGCVLNRICPYLNSYRVSRIARV